MNPHLNVAGGLNTRRLARTEFELKELRDCAKEEGMAYATEEAIALMNGAMAFLEEALGRDRADGIVRQRLTRMIPIYEYRHQS